MGRAWMPLYIGDYLRDTRDLNTLQHGAYLLLIMHYWQHDGLPTDEARLAAIAGLSVAQWRRIRGAIEAKFAQGWKHKRIEAEIAKVDRALVQRRLAGKSGGIKSGIARAVAQGEAILRAEAQGKRALARRASAGQAEAQAAGKRAETNHNHRFESSLISARPASASDAGGSEPPILEPANHKPANQWSRQELDRLFATRNRTDAPPAAQDQNTNRETGE